MKKLLEKIRKILRDRRTRRFLTRFVSGIAAVVVFVTTYALVLPAITMEKEADCGILEHQHSDSCYERVLVCGEEESEGHHHDDACYTVTRELLCKIPEHVHTAEAGCFDEAGNLICDIEEHVHGDNCYTEIRKLTCGIPESDGHTHTDECYEKVLICGLEAHTHSAACYSPAKNAASFWSADSAAVAATYNAKADAVSASATEASAEADAFATLTNSADEKKPVTETDPDDEAFSGASTSDPADEAFSGASIFEYAAEAITGEAGVAGEEYIPQLDPLNLNTVLNDHTGFYCHSVADGEVVEDRNQITFEQWNRIPNNTDHGDKVELEENDLLRVYLAYTVPAGSLNTTNPVACYRLPGNLRLTDAQVKAINENINGIADQYVNMDTLEILDVDKYNAYLGIEAVEGDRRPDQDPEKYMKDLENAGKDAAEYISATVKVENVYDKSSGDYEGQDLIFTWTPYSIEKNRHEYDTAGQPTKAGEKIKGWVALDIITSQVEWNRTDDSENGEHTTEVVFVENNKKLGTSEISTELRLVDKAAMEDEDETASESSTGETAETASEDAPEDAATASTEDAAPDAAADNEDAGQASTEDAAAVETDANQDAAVDKKSLTYPAVSFNDSITVSAGTLSTDKAVGNENIASAVTEDTEIIVHIEADEDTFPEGTTMKLAAVKDMGAVAEAVEGAMSESAESTDDAGEAGHAGQKTLGFHAVDISFWNAEGIEIEPLKPIRVSMTSDAIKRAVEDSSTAPVVVHIDDGHVAAAEKAAEEQNRSADDNTDVADDIGMVAYVDDKEADDAAESHTSAVDANADNEAKVEDDSENDSEGISEDVSDTAKDSTEAVSEIKEKAETAETTEPAEVTPAVTIIEAVTGAADESGQDENATDTLTFESGSFSVYAIVYTVDFHYEVNGKMYEFSLPGGGFVSLEHVVEMLGIARIEENGDSEGENASENDLYNVGEETGVDENGANSSAYEESISLNNIEVSEATKKFVADVASVEFSSPELVWVGKVEAETTVGGLKEANGLEVQYSAELTEEQIAEINSSTVEVGDWALISVLPFDTEESLTVTMRNGDQFVVRVTDAQPAATNMSQFNVGNTNRFVIWGSANGRNYVLKTDGTTEEFDPNTIDTLGEEYLWSIEYGWQQGWDYDLWEWDYRYRIRPANDHTRYLTLTNDGSGYIASDGGLVETAECGIRLYPPYSSHKNQQNDYYTNSNSGWIVEGWGWMRLNLGTATGSNKFEGNNLYCSDINISRQQVPYTYDIIVRTDDDERGGVSGYDKNGINRQVEETFTAITESTTSLTKRNSREIKAVPTTQKWAFDYWDLDGQILYWDTAQNRIVFEENQNTVLYTNLNGERASVINAYSLPISFNESKLTAHFKRNPEYEAPDDDKDGRPIDATIAEWLERLMDADFPLNKPGTEKTAEVYDYENRIFRVDITAKSNLYALSNTVKLGFIMDVSLSMEFPSQLDMVDRNNKSQITANKNNQLELTLCNINSSPTNKQWLDQSKTYYIIADAKGTMQGGGTATVDKIAYRYVNGSWDWYWKDASKADSAYLKIETTTTFHSNDVAGLTYPIYMAGDLVTAEDLAGDDGNLLRSLGLSEGMPKTRRFYLQKSMANTINTLQEIMDKLDVANNTSDSKDVLIAWNTFHGSVAGSDHNFKSPANVNISYAYDGGTSTQLALNDAREFGWGNDSDTTRIAILITDGAPQKSGNAISNETVSESATKLKNRDTATTEDDITLVTLGLSMGDVRRGEILLYDIASRDQENIPYYYEAESGNELELALAEIIRLAMANAIVDGNVTDTINEAFYPVDKYGIVLENGNVINLDGEMIAFRESDLTPAQRSSGYGVIHELGGVYSVTWTGQEISWDGWRGTIYEKAKEDFLGGNAVRTNDPQHQAVVTSTGYKLNPGDPTIAFKQSIKDAGTKSLETPRVNVNELQLTQNSTEWTVYLGTTVDPLEQIKALYNKIRVNQVITNGTDTNHDGFKDKAVWDWESWPYYYEDVMESASDSRDNDVYGEQEFFYLKDLIKKQTGEDDIDWDTLIALSELEGDANTGITIPYNLYGQDNPGWFTIKMEKDHNVEEHATDEIGEPVETYTLTVFFSPLYDHIPVGQGGDGLYPYHTGKYGLGAYGLASGTEESINEHIINVFAKNLEIQKKDMGNNQLIDTAKFKLYRTAKSETDEVTGDVTYESGTADLKVANETKKVVQIGDEMTTSGGKITVEDLSYAPDGTYYLVETKAPDGYIMAAEPIEMHLYLDDSYTKYRPSGESISQVEVASYIANNPYNWAQSVNRVVYNSSKTASVDDTKITIEVLNNPGVELPATGGPGTNLIYLFGIMLTGLAGSGLMMRRKRKAA